MLDEIDDLFVQLEAVGVENAASGKLFRDIARRCAVGEPAFRKVVERREIFQELHRRVERADENIGDETHALGQAAHLGQEHERAW